MANGYRRAGEISSDDIKLDSDFKPYAGRGSEPASTYFVNADRVNSFAERKDSGDIRRGAFKNVSMFFDEGVVLKEERSGAEHILERAGALHAHAPGSNIPADLPYKKKIEISLKNLLTSKSGCFDGNGNFFYGLCAPTAYLASESFRKNVANINLLKGKEGLVTPLPLGFTLDKDGSMRVLEEMVYGDELAIFSEKGLENFGRARKFVASHETLDDLSPKRYTQLKEAVADYNIEMLRRIADAPKHHWQQLINSYFILVRANVPIDIHVENIFYEQRQGFPIIDFCTMDNNRMKKIFENVPKKNQLDYYLSQLLDSMLTFQQKNTQYRTQDFLNAFHSVKKKMAYSMMSENFPSEKISNIELRGYAK